MAERPGCGPSDVSQLSLANRNIQVTRGKRKGRLGWPSCRRSRQCPSLDRATPSGLESALDRVGDRWSLLVVDALLDGPRRFGELRESLPAIAPNILTDRLRRLQQERILRLEAIFAPGRRGWNTPSPATDETWPRPFACCQIGGAGGPAESRSATTAVGRRSRLAGSARRAACRSATRRSAGPTRRGSSDARPLLKPGQPCDRAQRRRAADAIRAALGSGTGPAWGRAPGRATCRCRPG